VQDTCQHFTGRFGSGSTCTTAHEVSTCAQHAAPAQQRPRQAYVTGNYAQQATQQDTASVWQAVTAT
jgi:hypothetical protein